MEHLVMGAAALFSIWACTVAACEASVVAGKACRYQCIRGRFSDAQVAVECQAADGTLISYEASTNDAGVPSVAVSKESNACSLKLISRPLLSCSNPSKNQEQFTELTSTNIKYTVPFSFSPEQPLGFCTKVAAASRLVGTYYGNTPSSSSSPSSSVYPIPVYSSPSSVSKSPSPLKENAPPSYSAYKSSALTPSAVYKRLRSPYKSPSIHASSSPSPSQAPASNGPSLSPGYSSTLVPVVMILVFLMLFMIRKLLLMHCNPSPQVQATG